MLLMLFVFLCFCGQTVMFWYFVRTQERHYQNLRGEVARLRELLEARSPVADGQQALDSPSLEPAPPRDSRAQGASTLDIHIDSLPR